jgi:hypothetical protein
VRYRHGPLLYPATICHCDSCRRISGAHAVAFITVAAATVVHEGEQPVEYCSSPGVFRGFCAACRTPLTYRREQRPAEVDITLATLDAASDVVPADHVWMQDALPWDRPSDGLPQFPGSRDGAA